MSVDHAAATFPAHTWCDQATQLRVDCGDSALVDCLLALTSSSTLATDESILHVTTRLLDCIDCLSPSQLLEVASWSACNDAIDPELHLALLSAAVLRLPQFHRRDLLRLTWTLAVVAVSHSALSDALLAETRQVLSTLDTSSMSRFVWSLAVAGSYDAALAEAALGMDWTGAAPSSAARVYQARMAVKHEAPDIKADLDPASLEHCSRCWALSRASTSAVSQALARSLHDCCLGLGIIPVEEPTAGLPAHQFAELPSGHRFSFYILAEDDLIRDVRHSRFLRNGQCQLQERLSIALGLPVVAVPPYDLRGLRSQAQRRLYVEACVRAVGRECHRSPKPESAKVVCHSYVHGRLSTFAKALLAGRDASEVLSVLSAHPSDSLSIGDVARAWHRLAQVLPATPDNTWWESAQIAELGATLYLMLVSPQRVMLEPWQLVSIVWAHGSFTRSKILIEGSGSVLEAATTEIIRRLSSWKLCGPPFVPFGGREVSIVLWALGATNIPDNRFFDAALPAMLVGVASLDSQGLANAIWACAKCQRDDTSLFRRVAVELAQRRISATSLRHEVNVVWGFASVGRATQSLFVRLSEEAVRMLPLLSGQDVSNVAFALARVSMHSTQLLTAIAASKHISTLLNPEGLCMVLWAMARCAASMDDFQEAPRGQPFAAFPEDLEFLKEGFFHDMSVHILDTWRAFDARSITTICWSFATLAIYHPELFRHSISAFRARLDEFNEQGIANLSWAMAVLGVTDVGFFASVAAATSDKQATWEPSHVCNVAWSLVVAGYYEDVALLDGILRRDWSGALPMHVEQLLQVRIAMRLECFAVAAAELGPLPFAPHSCEWTEGARNAFDERRSSVTHLRISSALDRMAVPHVNEHRILGQFVVDVWIQDTNVVLEVDGPCHFVFPVDGAQLPYLNGPTRLKQRLLRGAGYIPISVPYFHVTDVADADLESSLFGFFQALGSHKVQLPHGPKA